MAAYTEVGAIELTRLRAGDGTTALVERGGLAGWQRRILCDFMNDNLTGTSRWRSWPLGAPQPDPLLPVLHPLGMPPHQYQVHLRVEHAKHLLTDTDRSITEVAIAAGYSASSNFATVIRRVTGVKSEGVSP